jgi:hypothetical protein
MRAALARAVNGDPVRLPNRVNVHIIAARYGMSLEEVRDMPADDFLDALNFLGVTG